MSTENPNTVINEQGVLLQDRVVNGVTLTAGMGPAERAQALARSVEAGTYAPVHNNNGPPIVYQTPATQQRFAQGEKATAAPNTVGGKSPPPSPKQLERQNAAPSSDRIAEFDAEMRAAGKQITPQSRDASGRFASVPADQVDAKLIDALNQAYRALPAAERDAKRALYQAELAEAYAGRRSGESRAAFTARKNGGSAPPPVPAQQQYTPQQWQEGHKSVTDKDGWIPLDRINVAGLSGYTLPKFIDNQFYNSGVFQTLADARAAGVTQEQVNAFIKTQMTRDGWLKA